MADFIPLPNIEARLENWGTWSRRQALIYEQCESLEGNYRSPQHWEEVPGLSWQRPEDKDAFEISLACGSLVFCEHLTLKLGYVERLPDYRIAEVLTKELRQRVKARDIFRVYGEAKANLQLALRMGQVLRRTRTVDRIRALLPRTVDMMID